MNNNVFRSNKIILYWELAGFLFILIFGTALHFAFELSGFWKPVAVFAAVNESTWEHLKLVFWPGLFFFLIEYRCLKLRGAKFWTAKALCLVIMPLIIFTGWYSAVALWGANFFILNIALFIFAIFAGQLVSYRMLTAEPTVTLYPRLAFLTVLLLALAFATFTFLPPHLFLFEHMDLLDTGQYGILDSYEGLLLFK